MQRLRFPIGGLMAAVAAAAVNLAVIRAFDVNKPDALPHLFFVCGVTPMASILFLVALFSAPQAARGGRVSSFALGFEALGWVAVFAFVAIYSIKPAAILAFTEWTGRWTRPVLVPLFEHSPMWAQLSAELGVGIVLFSLPELIVALGGGWLAWKIGLTVRFEIGGKRAVVGVPVELCGQEVSP